MKENNVQSRSITPPPLFFFQTRDRRLLLSKTREKASYPPLQRDVQKTYRLPCACPENHPEEHSKKRVQEEGGTTCSFAGTRERERGWGWRGHQDNGSVFHCSIFIEYENDKPTQMNWWKRQTLRLDGAVFLQRS